MSTPSSIDRQAFTAFEHTAWESNVSDYEAAYARVTAQSIEPLLNAVVLRAGDRLLDVATGPGDIAPAATARGALFCGVDFSSAMMERARARQPGVTFEVGDAEALPFPDASFDAVVMNFGMLHLAKPERAMVEAARVLKAGRRYAFTVWDKPEETVGFGLVLNAIRTLGNPDVPLPAGPPFFRFSEASECERSLRQSGFVDIRITRVPQAWRFETPDEPFDAIYNGGVRIKATLRAQTAEARAAIREAVCEGARGFLRNGMIELPMPAVLASAAKA